MPACKDVDSKLSLNFDRGVLKPYNMTVHFASLLKQEDGHIQMFVQCHRRAMPNTFSQEDALSFLETENSEAFQLRQTIRLLWIIWWTHIHEAIGSHRNQQLIAVHMALGPIETELSRIQIQ